MPAQVEQRQSNQAGNKYDKFVLTQLEQTGGRVRKIDLFTSVMVLVIGVVGYTVLALCLDRWLQLSSLVRLAGIFVLALGVVVYLGWCFWSFFLRRVNPYYAALRLEKTLPNAKGSVVNWLDLHEQKLPSAIHNSLSVTAAKDLGRADVDQAVPSGKQYWLFAVLLGLCIPLLLMFALGPQQFASLLARSFMPFREIAIASTTRISLLEPDGGNLTVAEDQAVMFRVRLEGRVPDLNGDDSPRLLFRYSKSDLYQKQPLLPVNDSRVEWTTTLVADKIPIPGVYYRITAGDAETKEYFIRVQSVPMVKSFTITYHPRPYRPWAKRSKQTHSPYIEEYLGTEVVLQITANRELKSARLDFEFDDGSEDRRQGTPTKDDPHSMLFRFPLEKRGTFKVQFTSKSGEKNVDVSSHRVRVYKDEPPMALLQLPGRDVQLPADGFLQLKGVAEDKDEKHLPPAGGVKEIRLQMKVVKGHPPLDLQPKIYREGKSFKLAAGRYPQFLAYKDFVELSKVKRADGKVFPLAAGMELEYWLEVTDICDLPNREGNPAESKVYKIQILPPEKNEKEREKQKKDLQNQQQDHEKKQDEKLKQQSDQINKEQQKQKSAQADPQNGKGEKNKHGKGSPQQNEQKKTDEQKFQDLVNQAQNAKKDLKEKKPEPGKVKGKGPADAKKSPSQKSGNKGKTEPKETEPNSAKKQEPVSQKKSAAEPTPANSQSKDQGTPPKPPEQPPANEGKSAGEKEPQPEAKGDQNQNTSAPPDGVCKKKGGAAGGGSGKAAQAKKGNGSGKGAAPAQSKAAPPPPNENTGPGQAKGEPGNGMDGSSTPQAGDPGAGKKTPMGKGGVSDPDENKKKKGTPAAQGGDPGTGGQTTTKKGSPPDAAKKKGGGGTNKGTAKGNKKDAERPDSGSGGNKLDKDIMAKIKEIEKKYNAGDEEGLKKSLQELEQLGKTAEKPHMKEAVDQLVKAIKEAKKEESQKKTDDTTVVNNDTKGTKKKEGKKHDPGMSGAQKDNGEKKGKNVENGKGKDGKEKKSKDTKKGTPQNPDAKEPGSLVDDGKPEPPNSKFAKALGNLQLLRLKDKIAELKKTLDDPDVQEKLQWTPEQKKWAEQYMKELIQKAEEEALTSPGAISEALQGLTPTQIKGPNAKENDVNANLPQRPPEYESAFQSLTTDPALTPTSPKK